MRYTDSELFGQSESELNELKEQLRFNEFCDYAVKRLKWLIDLNLSGSNWIEPDAKHLMNYRIKAIAFYEHKRGSDGTKTKDV